MQSKTPSILFTLHHKNTTRPASLIQKKKTEDRLQMKGDERKGET